MDWIKTEIPLDALNLCCWIFSQGPGLGLSVIMSAPLDRIGRLWRDLRLNKIMTADLALCGSRGIPVCHRVSLILTVGVRSDGSQ